MKADNAVDSMLLVKGCPKVAVIGSGPTGLMAATVLANAGCAVHLFEKEPNLSRKLFIAGSSGLNVSTSLSHTEMMGRYSGPKAHWETAFSSFSVTDWLKFIRQLGLEWFQGTSARYFVRPMNALPLVRAWKKYLISYGVQFFTSYDCRDFSSNVAKTIQLHFLEQPDQEFSAVCLALGGGSYEESDKLPPWLKLFMTKGLSVNELSSANVGFEVAWSSEFLKEAEGKPLKNIALSTTIGQCPGELMVTQYGLEGTPVYEVGIEGQAFVDLKPDLTRDQILARLARSKENLSPIRRVKKFLNLNPVAYALLFHHAPKTALENLEDLVGAIKQFPIALLRRRPLQEAISSAGGLCFSELTELMMLRKYPGVFAAGEMLDWQAPTGGFLIQGCVSEGYLAGLGMLEYLEKSLTKAAFGLPKPV